MAWFSLVIAGMLEAVWAYSMKQSAGFTKLWPAVITVVVSIASLGLLSMSMRTLPLGTSYAVWTGIGAFSTFFVGAIMLNESLSLTRIAAAALIVCGLLLMKISAPD